MGALSKAGIHHCKRWQMYIWDGPLMEIMKEVKDMTPEERIRDWQKFVVENRDIFEKIAKGLKQRKRKR